MKKILFLFVILFFIGGAAAYFGYQKIFSPVLTEDVEVSINEGDGYDDLLTTLSAQNIVKDEQVFNLLAEQMNLPNRIFAGKYQLTAGMSYYEIVAFLRLGTKNSVRFVLNNVNFKQDFAKKVAEQLLLDSTEVMNFLTDDSALAAVGMNQDDALCYFIPNTYEIYWNTTLDDFITRMKKEHEVFWNEERMAKAENLGLTPNEVFVLASIVEKEYKYADERQRIAGVYLNRIAINMKLQADPTAKYAWGDLSITRVLNKHIELEHPYNTYYVTGLPPGPICMPETATIDDVLNAEEHSYIYFCAKADLSGYHTFNTNYNGHLQAAREYQNALNELEIYQ